MVWGQWFTTLRPTTFVQWPAWRNSESVLQLHLHVLETDLKFKFSQIFLYFYYIITSLKSVVMGLAPCCRSFVSVQPVGVLSFLADSLSMRLCSCLLSWQHTDILYVLLCCSLPWQLVLCAHLGFSWTCTCVAWRWLVLMRILSCPNLGFLHPVLPLVKLDENVLPDQCEWEDSRERVRLN